MMQLAGTSTISTDSPLKVHKPGVIQGFQDR
jgi:hypothetical protein